MSEHASHLLLLFVFGLIVIFKVVFVVRRLWNLPLEHGREYFLGAMVEPGFYSGPGVRWLKWYRAAVVAEHLIFAILLVAFIVTNHWDELPLLAPIDVGLYFVLIVGFMLWARRMVRVAPARLSAVAITLETRRLGSYISWPVEGIMAALLAGSWVLMHDDWRALVVGTYLILGLLPWKAVLIRKRVPLPAERTEEHYAWTEACLRHNLRLIDLMRWFFLIILVGVALQHGRPLAKSVVWPRWIVIAAALGVWVAMTIVLIRGGRRVAAMGRGLRPSCSWRKPFDSGRPAQVAGTVLSIAYFAGLAVMIVLFRS
jgi:hypothetical protein